MPAPPARQNSIVFQISMRHRKMLRLKDKLQLQAIRRMPAHGKAHRIGSPLFG
jgi:hypothetical protein